MEDWESDWIQELFYHIMWTTLGNVESITPEIEPALHETLIEACEKTGGQMLAVNTMPDHVHVICTISPEVAPDDFVAALKTVATARFNLQWQIGCGGMTLGDEDLKIAIPYVENQKHHHQTGTIILDYEMTAD